MVKYFQENKNENGKYWKQLELSSAWNTDQ